MSVDTYVEPARTRAAAEEVAFSAEREAFCAFSRPVQERSTGSSPTFPSGVPTTAGGKRRATSTGERGCLTVCRRKPTGSVSELYGTICPGGPNYG
jgi:hypothetical protein